MTLVLQQRAVKIAQSSAEHPEKSLSGRFDDWAGLKAAHRFFSHLKATSKPPQSHLKATSKPLIRPFNSLTIKRCWKRLFGLKNLSYSSRMAQSFCSTLIYGHMDLDPLLIVLEMDSCFTRPWSPNIRSLKKLKFWELAIKKRKFVLRKNQLRMPRNLK
jgi:hypothetical protein